MELPDVTLKKVDEWPQFAGEYNFDTTDRVILACPVCGGVFVCIQKVEQKEPLTLSPSILGPKLTTQYDPKTSEQVLAPCMHHFFVKEGIATGLNDFQINKSYL